MPEFIGISENREKHVLAVARRCYAIAKEQGYNEKFCRNMWLIGYLHDIGYEFCDDAHDHPDVGAAMLQNLGLGPYSDAVQAIKHHGRVKAGRSIIQDILNQADLTTNSRGEYVTVEERLEDIRERYGSDSDAYQNTTMLAKEIGLLKDEAE